MDTAITRYIALLSEHRSAVAKLDKYALTMRNVAHQLSTSRDNFAIARAGISLPIAPQNTVNGDELPDAGAIQTALKVYHDSKAKLRSAWQAVPDDVKSGLQQPPFDIPSVRGSRYG